MPSSSAAKRATAAAAPAETVLTRGRNEPDLMAALEASLRRAKQELHDYQADPAYPGDPVARCAHCYLPEGSKLHSRQS